jgi:hypothetical protein
VSLTNSLASTYPDIAAEWHPTKNGTLTPEQVVFGSHRVVWWKCPKGPDHEWDATIEYRTKQRNVCPFCRGLRISITNSLATLYPDLATEWHPTRNGNITPDKVVAKSTDKVWWQCSKGTGHEWDATIYSRISGSGCPYCNKGWTLAALRLFVSSSLHYENIWMS